MIFWSSARTRDCTLNLHFWLNSICRSLVFQFLKTHSYCMNYTAVTWYVLIEWYQVLTTTYLLMMPTWLSQFLTFDYFPRNHKSHLWRPYGQSLWWGKLGTPTRTHYICGLKSRVLKWTFFSLKMMVKSGLEVIFKLTEPLQSCCCPVQKILPSWAELAWQVSRYLWRGSVNFKINSRPLFTIIFKLKNDNFKTRDFSPLIERVLAGV